MPSPNDGSPIDNGAVSALYREKKKADHALHDHTFHEYALQCVRLCESMSVPTRGLSDMLDALTGGNQDDENKSTIHGTDEVQMHRLAASAAGSSSTLCLPCLPSASVATNIAQDQQNTLNMLMDMQQQMISFQTELMRALETATVAATAARGAADAAQGSGRPSGPPEPASVPNVRFGQSTNRIHAIKELHDEALKCFEKQALLHERNVENACEDTEGD